MESSWKGIRGQEEALGRLFRMLEAHRLPHALVFYGPNGVGKRRTAEALAASLLCLSPEGILPCGRCESCRALEEGTHPDVHVVRPEGSGRTKSIRIDQVRALAHEISRVPKMSPLRFVLADEAERMNETAQNSLLKTIEEPTGEVVFVLVTSARQALLDTMLSRCLPIPFARIPEIELEGLLLARGISAEDAARIIPLAGGSIARALALAGGHASEIRRDALEVLKRVPLMSLSEALAEGKRLGAKPIEELLDWVCYMRLLLRDLLALYGGAAAQQGDLAGALGEVLSIFTEARLFEIMRLAKELEKRLCTSNANARLQVGAFLLRAARRT